MACRASIHLPRREAQGHGLTLPAVTARPACCCSASGTHQIHLIFWHPPLPFPSPCSISFSASLPSHTTSRAAPWLWLTELSSRFSLTLTGRAVPLAAGSAPVPRTALRSYSSKEPCTQKHLSAWHNPATPLGSGCRELPARSDAGQRGGEGSACKPGRLRCPRRCREPSPSTAGDQAVRAKPGWLPPSKEGLFPQSQYRGYGIV